MSPLIFTSCRDYPSYLAFAKIVCYLLLPAETTVHEKWLPAETVCVILLPAETLGRKLNHMDSICRKLFTRHNSLGRKQEIARTAETTVLEKWLPAETVCVILLPAETVGRKVNHTDSLCRKLFTRHKSRQEARDCTDSGDYCS